MMVILEWLWLDMDRIDKAHRVADKYRRLGMSEDRIARLTSAMLGRLEVA